MVPTDGDVDRGWTLLAVCWAFVLCAFITTVLRVVVRSRLTRNLGWDDFWMVMAMVSPSLVEASAYSLSSHMMSWA